MVEENGIELTCMTDPECMRKMAGKDGKKPRGEVSGACFGCPGLEVKTAKVEEDFVFNPARDWLEQFMEMQVAACPTKWKCSHFIKVMLPHVFSAVGIKSKILCQGCKVETDNKLGVDKDGYYCLTAVCPACKNETARYI